MRSCFSSVSEASQPIVAAANSILSARKRAPFLGGNGALVFFSAHVRVVLEEDPERLSRPLFRVCDPDSGRPPDAGAGPRPPDDVQLDSLHEVRTIELPIDGERLGELRRPRAKVGIPKAPVGYLARTPASHLLDSANRLERADETGRRNLRPVGDDVHAPVHSVGEINIGAAAVAPHRGVSRRAAASEAMGGAVFDPEVGLDLYDPSRELLAIIESSHQNLSEKRF